MKANINETKCIGCGICVHICPQGIEMAQGKARIKNENAECLKGAANACPQKAIIIEGGEQESEQVNKENGVVCGFGQDVGSGRGMGAGRGKGLGRGTRDGRGGGLGGGGKRKW